MDVAGQGEAFKRKITPLPRSLYDAVAALDRDRDFLLQGEVFPSSFIDAWIATKRADETAEIAVRPHPYEYHLYLDA